MAGKINGRKTILKYGAPTEISWPVVASMTNGHIVPSKMVIAEAHKKMLFNNKPPSLETKYIFFLFSIFSNFMPYNSSEPAVTITKKVKIKIPLAGSEAKACTDVSKPDLTIKVPNNVNEKASIDNRIVQLFNPSLELCRHAFVIM